MSNSNVMIKSTSNTLPQDLPSVMIDIALNDLPPSPRPGYNPKVPRHSEVAILNAISAEYQVPVNALLGKSQIKYLVEARHLAMFMLHYIVGLNKSQIGRLCNRNYSTVIAAITQIRIRLSYYRDLKDSYMRICNAIGVTPYLPHK